MKKLLTSLMGLSILSSSVATVTACSVRKDVYTDIYLVTDAGKVSDKSFNQSGYEGGNEFVRDLLKKQGKTGDYNVGYIQPKDTTDTNIYNSYKSAVQYGAKSFILPGFTHAGSRLEEAALDLMQKAGDEAGDAIIIDEHSFESKGANGIKNTIGLLFKADMSGFYAGLSSIIYLLQPTSVGGEGRNSIKLGTYGGIDIALAVTNYMAGFLAAIDFIKLVQANEKKTKEFEKEFQIENLKSKSVDRVSIQESNNLRASNFFTQSFDSGKGKAISQDLIGNGADVILPVAGPQTGDTISEIRNQSRDVRVVGVDTDSVQQYQNDKALFITSAIKQIVEATKSALAHSEKYKSIGVYELGEEAGYIDGSEKDGTVIDEKESWTNKNIWFDGSISTSSDNKISQKMYDQIKDYLGDEGVKNMSAFYYSTRDELIGSEHEDWLKWKPNSDQLNFEFLLSNAKSSVDGVRGNTLTMAEFVFKGLDKKNIENEEDINE